MAYPDFRVSQDHWIRYLKSVAEGPQAAGAPRPDTRVILCIIRYKIQAPAPNGKPTMWALASCGPLPHGSRNVFYIDPNSSDRQPISGKISLDVVSHEEISRFENGRYQVFHRLLTHKRLHGLDDEEYVGNALRYLRESRFVPAKALKVFEDKRRDVAYLSVAGLLRQAAELAYSKNDVYESSHDSEAARQRCSVERRAAVREWAKTDQTQPFDDWFLTWKAHGQAADHQRAAKEQWEQTDKTVDFKAWSAHQHQVWRFHALCKVVRDEWHSGISEIKYREWFAQVKASGSGPIDPSEVWEEWHLHHAGEKFKEWFHALEGSTISQAQLAAFQREWLISASHEPFQVFVMQRKAHRAAVELKEANRVFNSQNRVITTQTTSKGALRGQKPF